MDGVLQPWPGPPQLKSFKDVNYDVPLAPRLASFFRPGESVTALNRTMCLIQFDDRSDEKLGEERLLMRLNQRRCQDAEPLLSGGYLWSCKYFLGRDSSKQRTYSPNAAACGGGYEDAPLDGLCTQDGLVQVEPHWQKVFLINGTLARPDCARAWEAGSVTMRVWESYCTKPAP